MPNWGIALLKDTLGLFRMNSREIEDRPQDLTRFDPDWKSDPFEGHVK